MQTSPDGQRPALGDRVGSLLADAVRLLARHVELFSAEARRSARGMLAGVLLIFAAAALLVFSSALLLVAGIQLLATRLPAWAATLVVMAVGVVTAVVLLLLARRQLRRAGFPETRRALKEDAEWLETLARSAKS